MEIYEIVFSPTGGTKHVADIITDAIGSRKKEIDLLKKETLDAGYSFTEEDVCIISVPSFGGRVPATAVERLLSMKGNHAAAVLVAVYGNRAYDDTLLELEDTLKMAGFTCIAAVAAVAEHSILRQFGCGRPDGSDEAELREYGQSIRQEIETYRQNKSGAGKEEQHKSLTVSGNHPYREYQGLPLYPKAGRTCSSCGVCAKECPVGAILAEDPKKDVDKSLCITCMRCISVCPNGARGVNKAVLAVAGQKMKKVCSERKENELYLMK